MIWDGGSRKLTVAPHIPIKDKLHATNTNRPEAREKREVRKSRKGQG
jgi:hypothetical protein